ncbi:hypothetical protein PHLCEN_2v2305 [Hermanssonia centrifuga]|uniref:Uncharacterized protein n=1 Tax=Hermanssonia centrifuga TaxID=98765 RepID=A0A2R6RPG9_9APHY|nr:hypothetical protein PHLCEN_2v2305 [Hermanssonia centrifuga]
MDPLDVFPTARPSNVFNVSLDRLDYPGPQPSHGSPHQPYNAVHPGIAVVFIPPEVVRSGENLTLHLRPPRSQRHSCQPGVLCCPAKQALVRSPNFFHAPPFRSQRMRAQRGLADRLPCQSSAGPPNVVLDRKFKRARSSSTESRTSVPSSQPWEEELEVRVVAESVVEDKYESDSGSETEPEDCPGCVRCSREYMHLHKAVYSHAAALAAVRTAFFGYAATALRRLDL